MIEADDKPFSQAGHKAEAGLDITGKAGLSLDKNQRGDYT